MYVASYRCWRSSSCELASCTLCVVASRAASSATLRSAAAPAASASGLAAAAACPSGPSTAEPPLVLLGHVAAAAAAAAAAAGGSGGGGGDPRASRSPSSTRAVSGEREAREWRSGATGGAEPERWWPGVGRLAGSRRR